MNRFCLSVTALLLAASVSTAGPVFSDPTGDVFGGTSPDIVSYSGDHLGGVFTFTASFAGAIAPASASAPNSIFGYIDLDTDQSAATGGNAPWGADQPGGNSWINFAVANGFLNGPPIGLGDEFFIDLGSELFTPGFVGLYRTSDNSLVSLIPISFTSNSFSLTFDGSNLGTPGPVNYGLYVGGVDDFAGDRAPNGALAAVTTPEPTSAVALGLLCAAAAGGFYRRRRAVAAA